MFPSNHEFGPKRRDEPVGPVGCQPSIPGHVTTTFLLDRCIMGNRPKPLKPRRNPAHIVFPKEGPVRTVVEEMPREKEELEFRVAQKFVSSLRRRNIILDDPRLGAEPAESV